MATGTTANVVHIPVTRLACGLCVPTTAAHAPEPIDQVLVYLTAEDVYGVNPPLHPAGDALRQVPLEHVGSDAHVSWRASLPTTGESDAFVSIELAEGGRIAASTWSGYRVLIPGRLPSGTRPAGWCPVRRTRRHRCRTRPAAGAPRRAGRRRRPRRAARVDRRAVDVQRHRGGLAVSWNWADEPGGSGVNLAACTTSSTSSGEAASIPLSATCADRAGNLGSAGPVVVSVDKTAPTLTCQPASYVLGGDATADVTATVSDTLSQPVASPVGRDVTVADLATPGVKTINVTGADRAGNTSTVACSYTVAHRFGGFTEPIPQSSYKRGSTIPVKFQLADANGTPIPDADAAALLSPTCRVPVTFDGVVSGFAGYDTVRDRFLFTLKTAKNAAPGTHLVGIRVTAPDGSGVLNTDSVPVEIKK